MFAVVLWFRYHILWLVMLESLKKFSNISRFSITDAFLLEE